jgi:hypothetical protein
MRNPTTPPEPIENKVGEMISILKSVFSYA